MDGPRVQNQQWIEGKRDFVAANYFLPMTANVTSNELRFAPIVTIHINFAHTVLTKRHG